MVTPPPDCDPQRTDPSPVPRHPRGALRVTCPASLRQEVSHLWVPAAAQVFPTNMVLPSLGGRGSAVGQVTAQQVTVPTGVTRPLLLVPAFIFIFVVPSSGNKGFSRLTDSGFTFCWAGRQRVMAGSQEDPVAGDKRHRFLPPGALHRMERRGGKTLPCGAPHPCWNLPAHTGWAEPAHAPELASCP